jgi:serine/threonine protein kinase
MAELLKATKNFSPNMIIDNGDSFLVYKARLSNGLTVAVKKLDPAVFPGFREVRAEVETLGKLRHPNIVKLLGYSASDSAGLFVYEFVEKGNLQNWLHPRTCITKLSWQARFRIVRGVADGLAYLHGLESPIVHRDIRPENVLLDSEFQAHITNFALARRIESAAHTHVTTFTETTSAYTPPEYKLGCPVATLKGDVFSFGVFMWEIATGRLPKGGELLYLDYRQHCCRELVDCKIPRNELNEGNVKEYFRIARLCASWMPQHRPALRDVVQLLSRIST